MIRQVHRQRREAVPATVAVLVALYAATFLVGALLHAGVRIPIGFAVLDEPRIVPAVIVEGLCALVLAVAVYAVSAGKAWAWSALTAAHAFALAGVLLGVAAITAGRGPHTVLNDTYHRVMIVVLATGLVLLSTAAAKAALPPQQLKTGRGVPSGRRRLRNVGPGNTRR